VPCFLFISLLSASRTTELPVSISELELKAIKAHVSQTPLLWVEDEKRARMRC
jgi:hypothetical protein